MCQSRCGFDLVFELSLRELTGKLYGGMMLTYFAAFQLFDKNGLRITSC